MAFTDVFGAGGEVRPLAAPGICFICESAPIQETDKVINTMRIFSPGPMTHLNGKKYVCGSCAHDLGVAVGLVDTTEHEAVVEERDNLAERVVKAEDEVDAFSSLRSALTRLNVPEPDASVTVTPAPAPAE